MPDARHDRLGLVFASKSRIGPGSRRIRWRELGRAGVCSPPKSSRGDLASGHFRNHRCPEMRGEFDSSRRRRSGAERARGGRELPTEPSGRKVLSRRMHGTGIVANSSFSFRA